jgi:hypothetical protein
MKRKFCNDRVSYRTRSKKPKLVNPLSYKSNKKTNSTKLWVPASYTRNFMIKDPLVDWLRLSCRRGTRNTPVYKKANGFTNFIMNKGVEFESKLIEYISTHKTPIVTVSQFHNKEGVNKTTQLMMKGVPVLHSAPVTDVEDNTGGIIDLLVRSDYLDKIIEECPLNTEEKKIKAPKLKGNYHYVVIDIKFSTLPLRSDGRLLLNSRSFPAYKAQTWIYTKAVGQIQGYTSRYAYIMGRRWNYIDHSIKYQNYTCLNKLGVIDFQVTDKNYKTSAKEALQWVRDVTKYGHLWGTCPPSRPELYPNMCIDSGEWNKEKEKIADRLGEITTVWNCGIKHRSIAQYKNINSWKNPKCTSENIGMFGSRASIIDSIMSINRQNKDKLRPQKIQNNMYNWKTPSNEMYVDFETLSDIFSSFDKLPEQPSTNMIFMIGVGWYENNEWNYINFTCNKPTYEEEYRIMDEFTTFLHNRDDPKLYYWCAENTMWTNAENRQNDLAHDNNDNDRINHITDNFWIKDQWSDLCTLFKKEPIVLKDCFKFGLKAIAKSMRKHGMIKSKIESKCDSGMNAMINAYKCYSTEEEPVKSSTMKDISKYNQFDVKVLWEILTYLRNNHC